MPAVNRVLRRHDGSLWLGGTSGLARLAWPDAGKAREFEIFGRPEGFPYPGVSILAEDPQENLWGSTEGSGIFRVAASGFFGYYERDGLGNARIASIFEDLDGRLCVMTSWDGTSLRVRNGGRFERVDARFPDKNTFMGWGWNQIGFQAHDGEWWLPTGGALLRYPRVARIEDLAHTAPTHAYGLDSGLGASDIFRVFEDSSATSGLPPSSRPTG